MQNSPVTLENGLAVSYNVKHTLTYNTTIPVMGINPRKIKTSSHKDFHQNFQSSLIHDGPKLETGNCHQQLNA